MQSTTNLFILNLALSDVLQNILQIVIILLVAIFRFGYGNKTLFFYPTHSHYVWLQNNQLILNWNKTKTMFFSYSNRDRDWDPLTFPAILKYLLCCNLLKTKVMQ